MTKFRPILFSTPMVQALLNGTKTQTRRTQGLEDLNESSGFNSFEVINDGGITKWLLKPSSWGYCKLKSPYNVGDILWVRESFGLYYFGSSDYWHDKEGMLWKKEDICYRADKNSRTFFTIATLIFYFIKNGNLRYLCPNKPAEYSSR